MPQRGTRSSKTNQPQTIRTTPTQPHPIPMPQLHHHPRIKLEPQSNLTHTRLRHTTKTHETSHTKTNHHMATKPHQPNRLDDPLHYQPIPNTMPSQTTQTNHRMVLMTDPHLGTTKWKKMRKHILQRDGQICAQCGTTEGRMSVDHIWPRSKGGDDHPSNLIVLCVSCNSQKGAKTHIFLEPNPQIGRAHV